MRIALFNTVTPFIRGGAEIVVDDLYDQLVKRNHSVTLFGVPFYGNNELLLTFCVQMLNFDSYDVVIVFNFPAYCAIHQNKVLWMFHQFRQVYELFGLQYGLADNFDGRAVKYLVEIVDKKGISQANKIFTIANEVSERLKKYNGLPSTVFHTPLQNYETYFCGETGEYIYYPSRVSSLKRQFLAVQAMKYVKTDVKLIIHGKCEDLSYFERIQNEIKKYDLKNIAIEDRWVSNEEKKQIMANSLAVMYIPYKEDSPGLVTQEGFYSKKPVISCTDSGGTRELIDNGKTGMLVESTPEALAAVMDQLYLDKEVAREMGYNAYNEIVRRDITWDKTIRRLLE